MRIEPPHTGGLEAGAQLRGVQAAVPTYPALQLEELAQGDFQATTARSGETKCLNLLIQCSPPGGCWPDDGGTDPPPSPTAPPPLLGQNDTQGKRWVRRGEARSQAVRTSPHSLGPPPHPGGGEACSGLPSAFRKALTAAVAARRCGEGSIGADRGRSQVRVEGARLGTGLLYNMKICLQLTRGNWHRRVSIWMAMG